MKKTFRAVLRVAAAGLCAASTLAMASEDDHHQWEVGIVVDAAQASKKLELGFRDQGLGLGHSDLFARGPLGSALAAEAILAAHTAQGRLEYHTERLMLRTTALPAGLSAVVGRFASQIGAINEQHPHADDFAERPLLYRGFLGHHWVDDGLRLNWRPALPFDLLLGLEAFSGRQLIPQAQTRPTIGATTVSLKMGGDLGAHQAWRFGLSFLDNRRQATADEHQAADGHHRHIHGAEFSGRRMWLADLSYTWAYDGAPDLRQIRLIAEHASLRQLHPESGSLTHAGSTVGAVWRFRPHWEVGARADWLRVNRPESNMGTIEFAAAQLREQSVMINYRPEDLRTYRIQYSRQRAAGPDARDVFASPVSDLIQFQVVVGFMAIGEHRH